MATYRWVGSGTTASTSPEIFNWNNASNWRKLVTSGTVKYFAGTTVCPGNADAVIFGNAFSFSGITNMEYTKSPCLFGGFVGNAAGGTWPNAATPYGTTLASSLVSFTVDENASNEEYGNGLYNFTYGRAGGSDNVFTEMPIGGGLTGTISCLKNLQWIQRNYPSMGVSVSTSTGGDYVFTVPAGYTSAWDNLTLKVRDSIGIKNFGIWARTGNIGLNFVPSYKPLASATGPVAINTYMSIYTMRDTNISGGAFKNMFISGVRDHGPLDGSTAEYPKAPPVHISNLYADKISISSENTVVSESVRFKELTTLSLRGTGYVLPQPLTRGPRKLIMNGSGSITQVNAVLYPGNTANTNSERSRIIFTLPHFNPIATEKASEVEDSNTAPKQSPYDWAHLNLAHQRYGAITSPGDTGETEQYWHDAETLFGESSVVAYGQNPYTQELIIGQADGLTSVDIDTISVSKGVYSYRDFEIPVLKFEGNANVNTVYLGNYSIMDCKDSTSTVNIGEIKLGEACLLSLNRCENNFQIGIRSSSGTTGGIMAMNDFEQYQYNGAVTTDEYPPVGGIPTGHIALPSYENAGDIKLFNVNTKKGGAIQITEQTIAEVPPPSSTNKKG
jgi:hypothetical protein